MYKKRIATAKIYWPDRPIETLPLGYLQALAFSFDWLDAKEPIEAVEVTLCVTADIIRMDSPADDYMDITSILCTETGESWTEKEFTKEFPDVLIGTIEKLWEDTDGEKEEPEADEMWPHEIYRAVRSIGEYPVPTAAGLGILSTNLQTITLQKAA